MYPGSEGPPSNTYYKEHLQCNLVPPSFRSDTSGLQRSNSDLITLTTSPLIIPNGQQDQKFLDVKSGRNSDVRSSQSYTSANVPSLQRKSSATMTHTMKCSPLVPDNFHNTATTYQSTFSGFTPVQVPPQAPPPPPVPPSVYIMAPQSTCTYVAPGINNPAYQTYKSYNDSQENSASRFHSVNETNHLQHHIDHAQYLPAFPNQNSASYYRAATAQQNQNTVMPGPNVAHPQNANELLSGYYSNIADYYEYQQPLVYTSVETPAYYMHPGYPTYIYQSRPSVYPCPQQHLSDDQEMNSHLYEHAHKRIYQKKQMGGCMRAASTCTNPNAVLNKVGKFIDSSIQGNSHNINKKTLSTRQYYYDESDI